MLVKPAMVTDYWSLLDITGKEIQWILDKALPDIVLSKQSIVLDSDNLADTFTITTNSTGNLSVSSSNNSITTVSLSGNIATVTAVANGTCTITVNVAENSNYLSNTKTLSVDAQLASTTLNDNSWDTIKATVQSGGVTSLWNVGDTKAITLNGTVGIHTFNNETYYATILGFDHNKELESSGKNSIHFIIGKNADGVDIAFCDSAYTSGAYDISFHMSTTVDNAGGWERSDMRGSILPQFKAVLPSSLQNVISNVTKYSDNTGGANDTVSYVTATSDQLFLLAEYEIQGVRTYANSAEQNKQEQYTYYANGASKVRYKHSDGVTAVFWWLRAPITVYGTHFCRVDLSGAPNGSRARDSLGLAPCFAIV